MVGIGTSGPSDPGIWRPTDWISPAWEVWVGMSGVPEFSSRDILLSAEVGVPVWESGTTKSSADPGSALSWISGGSTPWCSRSMHAKICLSCPGITSSGGIVAGIDGSAVGDPPYQTPSGGWLLASFGGSIPALCRYKGLPSQWGPDPWSVPGPPLGLRGAPGYRRGIMPWWTGSSVFRRWPFSLPCSDQRSVFTPCSVPLVSLGLTGPLPHVHPRQIWRPPSNTTRCSRAACENMINRRYWFMAASSHHNFWAGLPKWTRRSGCCTSWSLTPRGTAAFGLVVDAPFWYCPCHGEEGV